MVRESTTQSCYSNYPSFLHTPSPSSPASNQELTVEMCNCYEPRAPPDSCLITPELRLQTDGLEKPQEVRTMLSAEDR